MKNKQQNKKFTHEIVATIGRLFTTKLFNVYISYKKNFDSLFRSKKIWL